MRVDQLMEVWPKHTGENYIFKEATNNRKYANSEFWICSDATNNLSCKNSILYIVMNFRCEERNYNSSEADVIHVD